MRALLVVCHKHCARYSPPVLASVGRHPEPRNVKLVKAEGRRPEDKRAPAQYSARLWALDHYRARVAGDGVPGVVTISDSHHPHRMRNFRTSFDGRYAAGSVFLSRPEAA